MSCRRQATPAPLPGAKALPRDARMRACNIAWPDGSTEGGRFIERDPKSERHAIIERDLWTPYTDDWTIRVPIAWLTFQSAAPHSHPRNDGAPTRPGLPGATHPFGGKP